MTLDSKILTSFAMLALFAIATGMAMVLPSEAAFMPLMIGIPGVLLCGAQLIIDIRGQQRVDAPVSSEKLEEIAEDGRTELEMFFWLAVFTASLLGLGFVIGGPLAVLLFVHFEKKNNWRNSIFSGAGTFIVLWGIFEILLELTLFRGFILETLFP